MGTVIAILITLAIFLIFALNKSYVQLLAFLIFYLVLDWAILKIFSTTPLIGGIAISVGTPILSLLIYAIISLISMGIFYYVSQRYNYIISIIIYLVINLIINKFYMTISGNIFFDILFNFIIANIILLAYKKSSAMDDIKWFAIIAMIIDTILKFSISGIFFN